MSTQNIDFKKFSLCAVYQLCPSNNEAKSVCGHLAPSFLHGIIKSLNVKTQRKSLLVVLLAITVDREWGAQVSCDPARHRQSELPAAWEVAAGAPRGGRCLAVLSGRRKLRWRA